MKIYTRGGDKGRTSLFTGERVPKDDARIEALGAIDELVAVLGLAKVAPGCDPGAQRRIEALQTELYLAMADIAGETAGRSHLPADAVALIERMIDELDAELEPLRDFLIAGASPASAALHHARTVCRRAERRLVSAASQAALGPAIVPYLNRLADLLFILARWVDRADPEAGKTFRQLL